MPQQHSSVVRREGQMSHVQDLDLAIFCHAMAMTGNADIRVVDCIQLGPGKHDIVFHDPGFLVRQLEVEFPNSKLALFASVQRNLKRLMRMLAGHR